MDCFTNISSRSMNRSVHKTVIMRSFQIVVLTGDSITLDFNPQMTVSQLKEHIQMVLKHDVPKQKLLYNDGEIRVIYLKQ